VVYGGRISFPAGLGVVVLAAGIGVPFGLLAGYIGRVVDDIFMRLMDMLLAFPGIVLAIGVIAILGVGLTSAIIAIGVTSIPYYARFVRASTLSAKEEDYITAARVVGSSHLRIIRRHVVPNVLGPLVVLGASNFGYAILATAALSYLGLGTQPPTSDWGVLMSQGYQHMFEAASEVIFPGLAIVLTVLGVNLLADGLTDAFSARG
jgi:peptide/nickel transport system permease protein